MPDPRKRGGVSMDEREENRISGRGTEAEHGRNDQFTSEEARDEEDLESVEFDEDFKQRHP